MRKINKSQPHSMVCIIETEIKAGESLLFLLLSDLHLDHPKCNRKLLKQHMDECVARGGYILLNGDILCVMQGTNDKRHNKSSVRPENATDAYWNSIVDETVKFLTPYAERILFMGVGNHESAIIKRVEIDLLRMVCDKIRFTTGHNIILGQYHGWIYIKGLYTGNGNRTRRNTSTISYLIYHNHGTGGEAPVTGGTIEDHRKMTQIEGADAVWMGHNHNKYTRQLGVHYFDKNPQSFKPKFKIVEMIRTGTYKQEYTGHGFHIETNKAAKPLGGMWLNLRFIKSGPKFFFAPEITATWHEEIEIQS